MTERDDVVEVINTVGTGLTDPHIRIFNDRAYLYASHDHSADSTDFVLKDWQVWSSDDLLNWEQESVLRPEDTYIGKPTDGCWATDAVEHKDRYYWCFSEVDKPADFYQIGIVESESPGGPWTDKLGGPLIPNGLVDTPCYDPCLFKEDDGSIYILFGIWDYYIVRVSDDMRTIETPRPIEVRNPRGPYGEGKTDDKVFLHKRNGIYYLSWGSYYATSETLDGPYTYRGCIVDPDLMEPRFRERTWPHGPTQGRHGAFFEWRDAWYFVYCEMCFSNNRYFRDFWISHLSYADDGSMEPITIDSKSIT